MAEPSFNSHAIPEPVSPPMLRTGEIFRDGKFLIIRDGAILPDLCPLGNEPVLPTAVGYRESRSLRWAPPWAYFSLLLVPTPLVLFLFPILFFQKRGRVRYTLGPKAMRRERTWTAIVWVLIILAFAGFFGASAVTRLGGSEETSGNVVIVSLLAMASAVIIYFFSQRITAAGYWENGWFKLRGCSAAFLANFPEVPFESLR